MKYLLSNHFLLALGIGWLFFQSCGNDMEIPEDPVVVGPPQIEQLSVDKDTVRQDPVNILEESRVCFNYINEFGMPGASTDMDTLDLEVIDLRNNFTNRFLLYNGLNISQVSFIDGKVSFRSPGTCCIIDDEACMDWPGIFQTVDYEIVVTNSNGEVSNRLNYRLIVNCEE
ncbi:MAG: hypothetical protein AAF985_12740 [Bacteroidota bacterium]